MSRISFSAAWQCLVLVYRPLFWNVCHEASCNWFVVILDMVKADSTASGLWKGQYEYCLYQPHPIVRLRRYFGLAASNIRGCSPWSWITSYTASCKYEGIVMSSDHSKMSWSHFSSLHSQRSEILQPLMYTTSDIIPVGMRLYVQNIIHQFPWNGQVSWMTKYLSSKSYNPQGSTKDAPFPSLPPSTIDLVSVTNMKNWFYLLSHSWVTYQWCQSSCRGIAHCCLWRSSECRFCNLIF